MGCAACEIKVEGRFAASPLSNLPTEHQRFIEMFVLASGSLKEIAAHAGVSYPTVRSRLNRVIEVLRQELTQQADDDGDGPQGQRSRRRRNNQTNLALIPKVGPPVGQEIAKSESGRKHAQPFERTTRRRSSASAGDDVHRPTLAGVASARSTTASPAPTFYGSRYDGRCSRCLCVGAFHAVNPVESWQRRWRRDTGRGGSRGKSR